jgi:hypothetical protein
MRLLACRAATPGSLYQSESEVMDKESVERLRFDRRLQRRSGWVEETTQNAYLESLPDVSEKMTTCADEEKATSAAAPTLPSPSSPPSPPVQTAGDFSKPTSFGGFSDESGGN